MKFTNALIVDDSKVVRVKLSRVLEARQFKVDSVESGKDALEYLKHNHPDIIFMDFMMPDMDGFETTGIITKDPTLSNIPVVMCTGQDSAEERARAHENGASGFLTKPVEEPALDALIKELEEKTSLRKQAASAEILATSQVPEKEVISIPEPMIETQDAIPISEVIESSNEEILMSEPTPKETITTDQLTESANVEVGLSIEEISTIASDVAEEVTQTMLENAMEEISEAVREIAQETTQAILEESIENLRVSLQAENENLQEQIEANIAEAIQELLTEQTNALEENRLASEKEIEDQTVEAIQAALEESEKSTDQKLTEILDSVQEIAGTAANNAIIQGQEDIRNYIEQAINDVRTQLAEGGSSNVESTATAIAEAIIAKSEKKLAKAIETASTAAKEAASEKMAAFAKAQDEQLKNALKKNEPHFLQDPTILLSWLGGITVLVLYLVYRFITLH